MDRRPLPSAPIPSTPGGGDRTVRVVLIAVCAGLMVAGLAALVIRPGAPPVGPVPEASRWFDPALLDRIAAYRRPLYVVVPLAVLTGAVAPVLLVTRPRTQAWLRRRVRAHGRYPRRRIVVRATVVAVGVVALQDLLLLPWRWWLTYVHAGAFGLRTQDLAGWAGDRLVTDLTDAAGAAVVVAVVATIVLRLPHRWPTVVAVALAAVTGFVLVVWPLVVEPLRYDFVALPAGPTRTAVVEVAEQAGMQAPTIVVADASRRTTRRNAYVSGLGATRRIVLYDTLLELPDDQVAAVVAHEVAHARNHDLLRGWLTGAAATTVAVLGIGLAVRRRGPGAAARVLADAGSVAVVVALALALRAATVPVTNGISRSVEASADATALHLHDDPEAFAALQQSLVESNLSDPAPPAWWVWWRASHPPAGERIWRAERFAGDGGG